MKTWDTPHVCSLLYFANAQQHGELTSQAYCVHKLKFFFLSIYSFGNLNYLLSFTQPSCHHQKILGLIRKQNIVWRSHSCYRKQGWCLSTVKSLLMLVLQISSEDTELCITNEPHPVSIKQWKSLCLWTQSKAASISSPTSNHNLGILDTKWKQSVKLTIFHSTPGFPMILTAFDIHMENSFKYHSFVLQATGIWSGNSAEYSKVIPGRIKEFLQSNPNLKAYLVLFGF